MTHPETWREWIIRTPECAQVHQEIGGCVPDGGPEILAITGIIVVLAIIAPRVLGVLRKKIFLKVVKR